MLPQIPYVASETKSPNVVKCKHCCTIQKYKCSTREFKCKWKKGRSRRRPQSTWKTDWNIKSRVTEELHSSNLNKTSSTVANISVRSAAYISSEWTLFAGCGIFAWAYFFSPSSGCRLTNITVRLSAAESERSYCSLSQVVSLCCFNFLFLPASICKVH